LLQNINMANVRLTFFILLVGFSLSAQIKNKDLVGTWHYLLGYGGITGKGPGYTPEDNVFYHFSRSGRLKQSVRGKKQANLRYTLRADTTLPNSDYPSVLFYSNGHTNLVRRNGDTLFIKENMADGFEYVLIKRKISQTTSPSN